MEDRLRQRVIDLGHPVLSAEELEQYRGMSCIGQRRKVLADLWSRSKDFIGDGNNLEDRSSDLKLGKPVRSKK